MAMRSHYLLRCMAVGVVTAGMLTLAVPTPAFAGFFERIFGGLQRSFQAPHAPAQSFADPSADERDIAPPEHAGGPAVAYCVRSCDGRYFPVRAQPGLSAAEACHSFCPASQTRLYSGSNIDTAVALNGSRYADLPNAYVYRKQLVAGCTCNGHDAVGLAHLDASSDPTLRSGDVVVTANGLMAFTGSKKGAAGFTPVGTYSGLSKSDRDRLSALAVSRSAPAAPATASVPSRIRALDNRSAELEK